MWLVTIVYVLNLIGDSIKILDAVIYFIRFLIDVCRYFYRLLSILRMEKTKIAVSKYNTLEGNLSIKDVLEAHKQRGTLEPAYVDNKMTLAGFTNWINEQSIKGKVKGFLHKDVIDETLVDEISKIGGIIVKIKKDTKNKGCVFKAQVKVPTEIYKFIWGSKPLPPTSV